MMLLAGERVLCLGAAVQGALARFLASLGAECRQVDFERLEGELAQASFLLDALGISQLAARGLARTRIEALNPSLVHVSVSCFGSSGPLAAWRGSELVASALGGTLRVTGDPDRAPVKEAGDACTFHAEMVAAAGALAAHYERTASGRGQHVDVSIHEVACSRNVNGILVWQFDRRKPLRSGPALSYGRATVRCIWELADGYCFHSLMTGRFGAPANQALSAWMDERGCPNPMRAVDWNTYDRSALPADTRAEWEQAMKQFFRALTKTDIATDGRRRGINATVVNEPADVLADAHLAAREFFMSEGGLRVPGRFVRVTPGPELPAASQRATSATARRAAPVATPAAGRGGALAGVRVLDFSWALVGSYTTKVLGDLGAEVIKLETATRPCLSRIDVQVTASRRRCFDDKPWFAHMNTSKRSLALDLKQPGAREVLDPLIDWCEVIVENFSPGTMEKLGLDYETLKRRRPDLIMVSGSVYGQTGPLAREWGVDGTGAALSGRTFLTGWPDRSPVTPGAVPYGDVIVPYVMAAAVAAALAKQRRTGQGCHIDASMYEICVQQMRAAVLAVARGERPMRGGNLDSGVFHQGVYATQGEDCWLALTLFAAGDWQSFARVTALAGEEARACAVADAGDARDRAIARWAGERPAREAAEELQRAGLAAAPVQDVEDLVEHDAQLATRGTFVTLEHPLLGAFGHLRTPLTLSRTPLSMHRAPGLGEHSHEIARGIAQLDAQVIARLESQAVFR